MKMISLSYNNSMSLMGISLMYCNTLFLQ